jgi:probable F420-dependent oxidoreductase
MAYLAAITDRIVLATGALVLPNHHPVVLAKRIATIDRLSGGRVRMCMGIGWMDEEIAAAGADPRTRGRRVDESIDVLRLLWGDAGPGGADFEGEFFSFQHVHSFPKPLQKGGVPIHIAGHSDAAARRAGRVGDGFQPLGMDAETAAAKMEVVRRAAEEAGRDPQAIELSLSGYLPTTTEEEVEAAAGFGAVRMVLSTSVTDDLGQVRDELSAFAERFGVDAEAGAAR